MKMIVELFLIRQLLKRKLSDVTPKATVQYDPDYDWRLKKPKVVPQITKIVQPIIIDPTKIDYGQLDWKPDYKKGKF